MFNSRRRQLPPWACHIYPPIENGAASLFKAARKSTSNHHYVEPLCALFYEAASVLCEYRTQRCTGIYATLNPFAFAWGATIKVTAVILFALRFYM